MKVKGSSCVRFIRLVMLLGEQTYSICIASFVCLVVAVNWTLERIDDTVKFVISSQVAMNLCGK